MKERNDLSYTLFLFFWLLVLLSSQSEAKFIPGENSFGLDKNIYGPHELIEGYINISLINESTITLLKTNIDNQNISLIDFLTASGLTKNKGFICFPTACEPFYQTIEAGVYSKELPAGKSIVASVAYGKEIELAEQNAFEFTISGTSNEEYCGIAPVEIDLLDDGTIDWRYTKTSDNFCGTLFPSECYDDSIAEKSFDITQQGYCQKITLPISGKFKLAALVKKNKGNGDLVMFIYDKKNGNIAQCDIDEPNTTSWIEKNCVVDFSVLDTKDQEYYVCIKDTLASNAYSVKSEIQEPICGYAGLPDIAINASADFALFTQPAAISAFNTTIRFNEIEFSKTHSITLNQYITDFIDKKYGGDCSSKCVIPIVIKNKNNIILKDLSLSYCVSGLCETENKIFDVEKKSALINMNFTKLRLEKANFSTSTYGNYTFKLWLGKELIGSEEIAVEKVPIIKNLIALFYEAAVEIPLFVEAYSPKNNKIVKYEWDFGDGNRETTKKNEVKHVYEEAGLFYVTVKVTDSEGLVGKRTFALEIGSPKNALNMTLRRKKETLNNISKEIQTLSWYKDLILKELNIEEIKEKLNEYEKRFNLATSEEEYINIMKEVKKVGVPKRMYDAELIQDSPLIVDVDYIRPEYLEQLGAGIYEPEYAPEIKNAIWNWQWENLEVTAGGRVIGVTYDDGSIKEIATILTFTLKSKRQDKQPLKDVYFILLTNYDKVRFASDYGQQKIIDAPGFIFKELGSTKKILIAFQGKIDINDIVFFASPSFEELDILPERIVCNNNKKCEPELGENWRNCREDCKPIGLAIFYLTLTFITMLIIYLFLQNWYSKYYERYLFKNSQDIYNLISFIRASLSKGMKEKEIRESLKKVGWTGEQISYGIKKAKGERVGLAEIKLDKIFGKLKQIIFKKKIGKQSTHNSNKI